MSDYVDTRNRLFGVKFWRTWGIDTEVADEIEEWVVLVRSRGRQEAADAATVLAFQHDRRLEDGRSVSVRNIDYVQDHIHEEVEDYVDDTEGEGSPEVFGQLFDVGEGHLVWRLPENDLSEASEIEPTPRAYEHTTATPRFFTVKVWKTWSPPGQDADQLELSVLLMFAFSAQAAAKMAKVRTLQEEHDREEDDGGVSEIRFLTVTNVYDTGTDRLDDLVDGSRPVYAERFPLDEWGPVGFSPLSSQPAR
jgi:hypothetical protein